MASVTMGSMAQDSATTEKYSVATNSFWSNWFVQANVAGSAFWGNQEEGNGFSKSHSRVSETISASLLL